MTWEYRVVKHTDKEDWYGKYVYFDIREVYHNGDDKLSWTVDHKAPIGDSLDELRADLNMMLKALDLPVLEEKGDTLVEVGMDNIGPSALWLERHKKWRRDRLRADYSETKQRADVDWLTDELERQLERNDRLTAILFKKSLMKIKERQLDREIKAEIDAIETESVNLDIKPEDWLPTPEERERLLEGD